MKDAPLETTVVEVHNVLFGPLGILSENWQGYHDYQLAAEEDADGEKVAVVDVTPKKTLTGTHGYGRVWVRETDGAVLKIEWKPESISGFEILAGRARKYGSELSIALVTEYGFEKNGIRFPNRDYSEEAYIKPAFRLGGSARPTKSPGPPSSSSRRRRATSPGRLWPSRADSYSSPPPAEDHAMNESLQLDRIRIDTPADANLVLGHAHFIKTAEDLYETVVNSVPQARFGVAFSEASGPRLVRSEGNDESLQRAAGGN